MNLFQEIFVPLCAAMAALIVARAFCRQISRRQALVWTLAWLTAGGFIADPNASIRVAQWLGIGRGSDLIFYLAILAGMVALVHFQNRYLRLEIAIAELIRRDAIDHAQRGAGQDS